MQWLFEASIICLFYLLRALPIKKNKIIITSYLGKGYGDNGKYIVEELLRRDKNYDIVWLAKDTSEEFPEGVRVVYYRSLRSIYELGTGKIWIDNRRKPLFVRKRKNQFYIMTWHGYMGIKKLEKDVQDKLEARYVKSAIRDSKMINAFISGSRWETNCIRNAFWYDGTILEVGYPRSDILFDRSDEVTKKVKQHFNIEEDTKIVMYAPTFRYTKDAESLSVYNLDWKRLINELEHKFGGKWKGMIRLHPNVSMFADKLNLPDNVLNVTNYSDMQELIKCCDCMISDYSSTIMDAGIAGKLGFIYASDYDDFHNVLFQIQALFLLQKQLRN